MAATAADGAEGLPPLAELVNLADVALQRQKDAESSVEGAATWAAGLFGASKWAPFDADLSRLRAAVLAGEDTPALRLKGATLARSLGVQIILKGQAVNEGSQGNEGARAADATYANEVKQEVQARALDELSQHKEIAVGLGGLVVGSIVGGPLGVLLGLGALWYAYHAHTQEGAGR